MDDGDRGQRITEKLRAWAVARQIKRTREGGVSLRYCIECGEEIPEGRRRVQSGCKRCVECQAVYERRKG